MTRAIVMIGWDDVPHLSAAEKADMMRAMKPHQQAARMRGIPRLGAGAIYPIDEREFTVAPFAIPVHWPRAYGLDVGWNRTAAIFGVHDRESDTVYLYSEHYRGQAEPSIHAEAIRRRGEWIPGAIDPASRGRGQKDGEQLLQNYRDLGLKLHPARNAVDGGIDAVFERLSTGRLKVFKTCQHWLAEYRIYRRDDKGRVVKENDHLMDATRYFIVSGLAIACVKPVAIRRRAHVIADRQSGY